MRTVLPCEIKIKSRIENLDSAGLPEGDIERTESFAEGFYHYDSDGDILITYAEESEGSRVESEIVLQNGSVTVKRSGATESEFVFSEGRLHRSLYRVPPYAFDAEIMPKRVRVTLGECGGGIDLFYSMKIGGADKAVRMTIDLKTKTVGESL
ncbi:MAG: DUF1934 domain-containing protein [Clostridia bacterium]|nr:DUF1934 domain-containing protein [Clostridia bacterium]